MTGDLEREPIPKGVVLYHLDEEVARYSRERKSDIAVSAVLFAGGTILATIGAAVALKNGYQDQEVVAAGLVGGGLSGWGAAAYFLESAINNGRNIAAIIGAKATDMLNHPDEYMDQLRPPVELTAPNQDPRDA